MNEEQSEAEVLLSFDEAVKFLDTSKSTLYRLLSQEEIQGVKVGKQWRFRKADLTAYIQRSPVAVAVDENSRAALDTELAFLSEAWAAAGRTRSRSPEGMEPATLELKVVALVDRILLLAVSYRASDVHLESGSSTLRLRFRIDGVMQDIRRIPMGLHEPLVLRFKEMFMMNLIERRIPQDGRALVRDEAREYDMRMSSLPTIYGENLVTRILDKSSVPLGLDQLGTFPNELDPLLQRLHRSSGMIIATGPAGSGKTTLLYSCLAEISTDDKKALAVEDPVELTLEGVTATQVRTAVGLTFPVAMRSILRQDPDIIYCSELRDLETAQLALQSSAVGCLTLSALHAPSALAAISRLVGMGVEPSLIVAGLSMLVATRLARRLCPHCKLLVDSGEVLSFKMKLRESAGREGHLIPEKAVFYSGVGCDKCRGSGYIGRLPLYELLACNQMLVGRLLQCQSEQEMTELAVSSGMHKLLADGIRKAAAGETSLEEVMRATGAWL
jgi:general secretion pathway protein E